MHFLDQNIKGHCARFGVDFQQLLEDFGVDNVHELSILDLEAFAEENETDLYSLLFQPLSIPQHLLTKLKAIKLLIVDIDGVMTDGGMYYSEGGDQMKKYNTKDGRAIIEAQKRGLKIGIISSGMHDNMVLNRAKTLGVEQVYVGLESKIDVLGRWCAEMKLDLSEVAIVGDDINDLSVIEKVGVSFCPSDAVQVVKRRSDIVLSTAGGKGCVRELIDNYLLEQPLGSSN